MAACVVLQRDQEGIEGRQQHGLTGPLQHAGIAEVVDVLRGAAEMHQLEQRRRGACCGQAIAHMVFNRFDVMVDALLDLLDGHGRLSPGLVNEAGQTGLQRRRQRRRQQTRHLFGQVLQPQGFDPDAFVDERGFGKQRGQRCGGRPIAAVDG